MWTRSSPFSVRKHPKAKGALKQTGGKFAGGFQIHYLHLSSVR